MKKLYAERNHMDQGDHYLNHVNAMTEEGLHSKSAIAAELAHRDITIKELSIAITSTTNFLIGMTLDRHIPGHARQAIQHRIESLNEILTELDLDD